ncbi:sugar-binding transcriptional regulator [Niallia oryzisoli]|uniref:sugar-binding transcriptional regulator n=1 Tax=Niallia oryzisoli TaxID=1737571 RepID=UPI003735BF61
MDYEERKEIVKIAIYYYYKDMTQEQIANKLSVSRSVISRNLQKAKDLGIVNFYIKDESFPIINMQSELEEKFHINKVIVAPSYNLSEAEVDNIVVKHAIHYLKEEFKTVNKVGISWGRSLSLLAREFPYEIHKDLTLVPLIGGMSNLDIEKHSNQICYDLMKKLQCQCNYLYAPALAENDIIRKEFYESPYISNALVAGRNVDMAILGIADPFAKNNLMRKIGYITNQDLKELEELEVVGDINSRFFNKDGEEVDCRINNQVIGISLEEIKNIPNTVVIASGSEKKRAVLSAVKAGYVNTLIIDDRIAEYLLQNDVM